MPNGRCRLHGGLTPSGIASPNYKHGRYSEVLPARLQGRYKAARDDGELLALREDVALTDARLADLIARVDTGESGALWKKLQETRLAFMAARRADDPIGQAEAITTIMETIGRGHSDYAAWREIGGVLEQRRKLVESERKRLIEMQQTITAEQAMVLVQALLASIRTHATERAALAAIQADFIQLTGRND
jgi:hypothetical protein